MLVTVEVIQDKAFNLLSDMESLNLIRLNTPIKNVIDSGEKLSDRFAGVLQLSDRRYNEFQNTLQEGRNWNRDFY